MVFFLEFITKLWHKNSSKCPTLDKMPIVYITNSAARVLSVSFCFVDVEKK